jgi:hypothetical protein
MTQFDPGKVLEQEIINEIDWRTKELSIIRLTPIKRKRNLTLEEKKVFEKYSAVAIYSLWEGFVHKSVTAYIRTLNSQNLKCNDLHINLITHDLDMKKNLRNERVHFDTKCEFIKFIYGYQSLPVDISMKIPTESNVNLKVLNKILLSFNLEQLPDEKFRPRLDKLLMIRNKIAHGESDFKVTRALISDLISTVSDSMEALANVIVDGYKKQRSLKISA